MHKHFLYLMATVLGTAVLSTASFAQTNFEALGFEKLVVPEPKPDTTESPKRVENTFAELLDVHNALIQLPELKRAQETQNERQKEYADAQKRMKALNDCNIKRLSAQFKNPAAAWDKITQAYDSREKELAIYINSSRPNSQMDPTKRMDIGNYSDEELSEMLVHWSLGNDIMTDVYANQDKWGTRKAPKSPSFPLWKDQKYLYDQTLNDFYTKVNTFFGVPPNGRPIFQDEFKYDYNRAEDLMAAHNAYIAKLSAKNPAKAALLPAEFKKGPAIAPRPLPPSRESVLYMGDVEKTQQVFPAWPEPWKKQIDNNFANYNPAGEFSKDFSGKSFRLKDSVTQEGPDKQNNRLNVYQIQKKGVDAAEKMLEVSKLNVSENQKNIQKHLDENGIKGSAKIDAVNPKQYEDLQKKLLETQNNLIRTIEKNVAGTDEEYTIKATIAAMKKDPAGAVYLTTVNASSIDQLKLEAKARNALIKEKKDYERAQQKEKNKPIDEMCLNGGM